LAQPPGRAATAIASELAIVLRRSAGFEREHGTTEACTEVSKLKIRRKSAWRLGIVATGHE
jgi:hypothetical protein